MTDVVILGGGASGMAAALSALENPVNRVTLIERQARLGRKLLTTGNGRCNLTNRNASPAHYHGGDRDFCRYALETFPVEETLAWFAEMGLETVTEPDGRVYPRSNMANSVLDVLRCALTAQPRLTLRAGAPAVGVKQKGGSFAVTLENGETIDLGGRVLEVGYLFDKAAWHHGYAAEAARACRDYAFDTLGAQAVYSIIRDTNIASQRVAERSGMTRVLK